MSGLPRPSLGCVGAPRLLAGLDQAARLDRVAHLTTHGQMPRYRPEELVDLADNIDLRGRGGAGFPFAKKLRSVMRSARAGDGQTAVVVNGSEGEPSCLKDTALLLHTPHLVLDGALLAAAALNSEDVVVGVTRGTWSSRCGRPSRNAARRAAGCRSPGSPNGSSPARARRT